MAAANWFRYTYLAHLSRPKAVRHLYRLVSRSCASRIVEVGISDLKRAWFFVPRMLHADSTVLRENRDSSGQPVFSSVSRTQIAEWASCDATRRAA